MKHFQICEYDSDYEQYFDLETNWRTEERAKRVVTYLNRRYSDRTFAFYSVKSPETRKVFV
jgi:hypothetical protein